MKKIVVVFLSALSGIVAPTAASAQDFYLPPLIDGNVAIGLAAQGHLEQSLEGNSPNGVQGFSPTTPGAVGGLVANIDLSYRYSSAQTQANQRNFIARTTNPAARANLEQMFAAQPTLMDDISGAVRGYGFDPHNVADAYAVWWINVWGASQKQNIEPDAAMVAAVKQQARNAFAATPDFAKTSDADRQEYAEALLLQAIILGSALEQWKNDPKMLDQLAEAARKGAKASGLDLSLMTLTPDGFVPRKEADASGAAEGGETALASADGGNTTGIALAAGAGLGITLLGGVALLRRG
jgi:hypothetical protein